VEVKDMATAKQDYFQGEKRYNPPKDYVPPLISKFINWVESINFKYSIKGDKPIYSNEEFP
jgi:hypothetical protein